MLDPKIAKLINHRRWKEVAPELLERRLNTGRFHEAWAAHAALRVCAGSVDVSASGATDVVVNTWAAFDALSSVPSEMPPEMSESPPGRGASTVVSRVVMAQQLDQLAHLRRLEDIDDTRARWSPTSCRHGAIWGPSDRSIPWLHLGQ